MKSFEKVQLEKLETANRRRNLSDKEKYQLKSLHCKVEIEEKCSFMR